jgi:hypothetical protein
MTQVISRLADRLRDADTVTAELFWQVMHEACSRLAGVRRTKDFGRLERLIQCGAWTDAALALLTLEIPQWQVRQLTCEAGQWHCTVSRQGELPDWLDRSVAACHRDLCVAIMIALVEVKRDCPSLAESGVGDVLRTDRSLDLPLCCDNFG